MKRLHQSAPLFRQFEVSQSSRFGSTAPQRKHFLARVQLAVTETPPPPGRCRPVLLREKSDPVDGPYLLMSPVEAPAEIFART